MELPRPALLRQITLRLSTEGRRVLYLAQDCSNGRIFTLPRALALALHRMKAAHNGDAKARGLLADEEAKEAYGFLHMVQTKRNTDAFKRKKFNPIFASIPIFDVGPYQKRLTGLARALVRPAFLLVVLAMAGFCVVLGLRNDWSIFEVFKNIFSIEALITFGLIAPVLKIVHEFGHVLVATRFGVRVRMAGVYLIGLYPMPFVDCTEADMTARRRHRIAISLAGLVVDVTIGLMAYIAWHFVEGTYLRTLLGNIFVFSTLNSVLFNANPLIKLDGYYAMIDMLGKRSLYTRSSSAFRDLRHAITSLGAGGNWPSGRGQWGLVLYAILALFYRINIMFVIIGALLPRYLGAGALVAIWGGYVMFSHPCCKSALPRQIPGQRSSAGYG